jgi:hypothetical protein
METQMAVAILLLSVLATMDRAVTRAGVLYGLCFLVRPDFGLFVLPALLGWWMWQRLDAVKTALITLGMVTPWLIFTTLYYGSPVPNTIKAKALRYHIEYPDTLAPGAWWDFVSRQVSERETWWHTFTPFLENGFVVDAPVLPFLSAAIAAALIGCGIVGMAATRALPAWRTALVFMLLFVPYRLIALPTGYYEWYYPPFTALLVLCASVALTRIATLSPRTTKAVALGFVALFAWPLPAMIVIDRRIQNDIEFKVRLHVAYWLRDHVPKGESVTSESAGYIGYYGRPLLYDYPGLTSKRTLGVMQKLGWQREFPDAARLYAPVAGFSVPPESSSTTWHGVSYVNIDREFVIVRRRGARSR